MTTDETHDAVALYVVDALTEDEARHFESHLATCAECQREVVDLREITAALSHSVEAKPPASLRASVLAAISTQAQNPGPESANAGGSQVQVPDNVVPLRSRAGQRLSYLVAAAAVVLALVFGGFALHSSRNASEASDRQAELISLLGASDLRTISSSVTGGGSGTVVLSRQRHQALFISDGMPTLPDDKVYELWTITTKPVPAGTFTVSGSGDLVDLPDAALSAGQIALTVEPAGGSQQPTSTPILAVSVPRPS